MNVLELIKNDTSVALDYKNIKDATSKLINDSMDTESLVKFGFKRSFYISLVSVLLIILIASIVLITYKDRQVELPVIEDDYTQTIAEINASIDNLNKLGTLEEKMIEIGEIEKQIQSLPEYARESIDTENLSTLKYENYMAIKNNVTWGTYLNSDISLYSISNIIDISSIDKMSIKSINKTTDLAQDESITIVLDEVRVISEIINLFDVPYSDVVIALGDENIAATTNNVQKAMSTNDNSSSAMYILSSIIDDNKCIDFNIYANGYILITINNTENGEKLVTNSYASLVKIDYNIIDKMFTGDGE